MPFLYLWEWRLLGTVHARDGAGGNIKFYQVLKPNDAHARMPAGRLAAKVAQDRGPEYVATCLWD